MNQFFDFKRFTLLVSKHWSENRKKYTLSLLAMAGLLFFWYGFMLIAGWGSKIHVEMQALTYFFGLAITGCFYGSILFNELASGPKAMSYLSFPASHFEKLLCGLLYGVLIFFVAYTAIFYLVNIPMVMIGNSVAHNHWISSGMEVQGSQVFNPEPVVNVFWKSFPTMSANDPNPFMIFILTYIAVQSAYILGSVYFPKFSFVKTTISLLVISLVLGLFIGKVLIGLLPQGDFFHGLTSFQVFDGSDFNSAKIVTLPGWVDSVLLFVAKYAFAPIFWIVTYFRFKEKQV